MSRLSPASLTSLGHLRLELHFSACQEMAFTATQSCEGHLSTRHMLPHPPWTSTACSTSIPLVSICKEYMQGHIYKTPRPLLPHHLLQKRLHVTCYKLKNRVMSGLHLFTPTCNNPWLISHSTSKCTNISLNPVNI